MFENAYEHRFHSKTLLRYHIISLQNTDTNVLIRLETQRSVLSVMRKANQL